MLRTVEQTETGSQKTYLNPGRILPSRTFTVFGLFLSLTLGSHAFALPFKVDIGGLSKTKGGVIEVLSSTDGSVLSKVPALANTRIYTLDFPSEGVFYLQVRNANKVLWKEEVFVLLKSPSSDILMKTSWKARPEMMRTVLRVQDPAGSILYGVSIRDKIFLRLRAVPRLVRVTQEDYAGSASAASELAVSRVTEKQAREENNDALPDIQFDPLASDDDQSVYEPEYKGLLAGKEDKSWREKVIALGGARKMEPLNRPHRVYGWLRIMQESFDVRRSPDTYKGEKTQGFGTGLGGNFVYKDTMSLQAEVDTHGTKTQYEQGGANPPSEEQRRIHARFGVLLDVLNVEHNHPSYALEVGPVIGYMQIPLEEDNQGKMDFGGSIRAQYFGDSHTELQLRFMKSHSRDISLTWIGTGHDVLTLNPLFGLYTYHTEFDVTDNRSEFNETGIRFGLSRDF